MWFEIIKNYYEMGLYSEADLDILVAGGMITEEEKELILASK